MRITTITYSRTKNLGNYESEKLEVTAEVENFEEDILLTAVSHQYETLRLWVHDKLNQKEGGTPDEDLPF